MRAYFNDKTPIKKGQQHAKDETNFISNQAENGGDTFNLEKLSRLSKTWFLKHWIVNKEKDKQKKVDSYHELKASWKAHANKNDIIAFWLNTDPKLTIPPYQSMTNRHPPKCQSLVLNEKYLDEHYPDWEDWLEQLETDDYYTKKLSQLKNGKGNRDLINESAIQLRQLQFILDTTKASDPYKLNEIWSIHHKLQQLTNSSQESEEGTKQWKDKRKKVINDSTLHETLKQDLDFNKKGSFAHFINKYYKTRKDARDGRYFIHQTSKNKWLENKLLSICTHKPRQKKYQLSEDLAAILTIDTAELKKITQSNQAEAIEEWFKNNISGFKSTCETAAKAQKDHRGMLGQKIYYVQKQAKNGERKKLNKENKELLKLVENCEKHAGTLAGKIWSNLSADEQQKRAEKFNSVFSFAQIHNIIFKDRNGFSNTCPVCSVDNAFRCIQGENDHAKASRLPALSIRLIDGLVMRICDATSRQIAKTCWNDIKDDLNNGKQITIPLILEQNRFEFEPNLAKLKGKKSKSKNDNSDEQYTEKENRIKEAAQGLCAYSGSKLGNNEEYDHIIPQASKYGTLNDEANLIYVSNPANQGKKDQQYFLSKLNNDYKKKIFATSSDKEIKTYIYHHLEGKGETEKTITEDTDYFCFGRYLSFINLNPEQRTAFRHALFLDNDDKLKQRVIRALQNRNRTIVNGTQRYMAQCIADKLYKIAKTYKQEKQLKFDYFEYSAEKTQYLRERYAKQDPSIKKLTKQPLYSHLIDAQMAFLLATDAHKNNGSMGIQFLEAETVEEGIDEETGEILLNKFYKCSAIAKKDFSITTLNRKKSVTGVRLHRAFHTPNFYAVNYVPLFFGKKNNDTKVLVKAGFSWENSKEIEKRKIANESNILNILQFAKNIDIAQWETQPKTLIELHARFNKKQQQGDYAVFYISFDKEKIQKHLVKHFSNQDIATGKKWSDAVVLLDSLSYSTKKETITEYKDIVTTLNKQDNFKIATLNIEIPAKLEWQNLSSEWQKSKLEEKEFSNFLKEHFLKQNTQQNTHKKVRKVFSLPVIDSGGHFLQKRNAWNGNTIYQIISDSDSRKDGNKFSRHVISHDGTLKEKINKPFVSKNIFKLKATKELITTGSYTEINPNKWIAIENENNFPSKVTKIEYCIDNVSRPQIRIDLADNPLSAEDIEEILNNPLTKAKKSKTIKEKLQSADLDWTKEYTASGFNKDIKKSLLQAMKNDASICKK